jgi:multiple sugar transport system substrate-binding protein
MNNPSPGTGANGLSRRSFLSSAAIAAGAAGLAPLAACSSGGGETSSSGGLTKIRVLAWSNGPTIDANFKNRVKAFNAAHKGKIEATPQLLPYDQYWQKIQLAYSAREPYDVYFWDIQAYGHYKKGLLASVQEQISQSPLLDGGKYPVDLYEPWKFDGSNMFGVPENVQSMVFFYNKDLFAKAGLATPDENWTWDDVLEAADKLTIREGNKTTQWGMATGDLTVWWGLQTLSWAQDIAFVDKELEPTKFLMSDPRNVTTMKFVQDLIYTHKVAPNAAQAEAFAQDVNPFATGRVAMVAAGGWNMSAFNQLDFEWAIAPLPKFGTMRVAPYWLGGWMIPKSTDTQDAAFKYALWSASDFQPQMAKDHDWIPLRTAERTSNEMVSGMPEGFAESLTQLESSRIGDIYHTNNQQIVEEVFNPTFDLLWANKITPEQAAKQIDEKGNALLAT